MSGGRYIAPSTTDIEALPDSCPFGFIDPNGVFHSNDEHSHRYFIIRVIGINPYDWDPPLLWDDLLAEACLQGWIGVGTSKVTSFAAATRMPSSEQIRTLRQIAATWLKWVKQRSDFDLALSDEDRKWVFHRPNLEHFVRTGRIPGWIQ